MLSELLSRAREKLGLEAKVIEEKDFFDLVNNPFKDYMSNLMQNARDVRISGNYIYADDNGRTHYTKINFAPSPEEVISQLLKFAPFVILHTLKISPDHGACYEYYPIIRLIPRGNQCTLEIDQHKVVVDYYTGARRYDKEEDKKVGQVKIKFTTSPT